MDVKTAALWLSGASLLWNLVNSYLLHENGKKNRTLTVKLEEFRNQVRAPIEAVFTELEELEIRAVSLSRISSMDEEHQESLLMLNQETVSAMSKLERRLDRADKSKFSEANDWADIFFAKEDAILVSLNKALDEESPLSGRRDALIQFSSHVRTMRDGIYQRFEDQVQKLYC